LNIMSEMCQFLMNGDKLPDAETICEMTTSHSSYLSIMTGPGSDIKNSVAELLLSLSPVSCHSDQIPILLSSYSATLHPSDRAVLTLLQRCETMAGVDMSPYQPLVWGTTALQHYNSNTNSWKQIKCSEILALLDSETMRRTCAKFPLHPLLGQDADEEETLRMFFSSSPNLTNPESPST